MKRTPLSIGSTIQAKGGSSYTYIIDRVIGDGASSIVYEAHYIDSAYGRHDVRLKECYPYASDIQRIETELVWANAETATNDKIAFTTAYHKLLDFQNTTKLRNSTAHIFDLCEANGTLYSVMDVNEGQTFEQDKSEKLSDILKTTLALARVVEKYHNNGYLHLDIKPSNFLVIPETRELVILFDVDSVTSMEDIASGKVKCVSYSKGWAAPEQMQGQIDKLSPATDIFSIGAILFQKVMGRAVENEDIGIFADWDFDGKMFEKVNPKIKRLLRGIFHKTLAANIKKRYQSTQALIATLDEAVKVADQIQYIRSYYPAADTLFIGRNAELQSIQDAFDNGKKCVIIQGYMGMGKSSIAIQYAYLHSKNYDNICWARYYESSQSESVSCDDKLKIQLNNLIENGETQDPNTSFIKFATSQTLVIIDNYDVDGLTQYVKDLLATGCKILITTRTVFKNLGEDIHSISLGGLQQNELLTIFESISEQQYEDTERLFEFFESQDNLTYSIILGAGQIKESCISLDEYLDDIYSEDYSENVVYDSYEDQVLNHHRRTARLHLLNEEQLETLRTVFVMSYAINSQTRFSTSSNGVFDRAVFKAYTQMNLNALNSLIRSRIVLEELDGTLSLHPSVQKLVEEDYQPSCDNCQHLYNNISSRLDFTINQSILECGVVIDIENGKNHEDDIAIVHELFDIYTWLCDSDPKKAKHLYNLFAMLNEYDTAQETLSWNPEENKYWHLEWVNREYFVRQLYNAMQTNEGLNLLENDKYIDPQYPAPQYDTKCRANFFIIDVCRHLLIEMIDDYSNFTSTLAYFAVSVRNLVTPIIRKEISNSCDVTVLTRIIQMCKPLFYNCLPITEDGMYIEWCEKVDEYPLGEGLLDEEYPFSIPICAWQSETTYVLYQLINLTLLAWLHHYSITPADSEAIVEQAKDISAWSSRISTQLYRIDKRFNTFFDFYAETPKHYNGVKDVDEKYISENLVFVDFGFDEAEPQYVSEILSTIEKSRKPYYLYSLILDRAFPLTNVAYDLLIKADLGSMIREDSRLNNTQKSKLLKRALEQFLAYEESYDTTDVKRLASAKCYRLSQSGDLLVSEDEDNSIEYTHHIVFLWYQIIRGLFNDVKLSKQYMSNIISSVQRKYISAQNTFFDLTLYDEYERCLIKDIPEFSCPIETTLFEMFISTGITGQKYEAILSDSVYKLVHGIELNYDQKTIKKAIKSFIANKGDDYNPFDYELLEYWSLL